jgi:hypothetical protein
VNNALDFQSGSLDCTGMRSHELALQRWLNKSFLIAWGVPIPVIFSSPMDAMSEFSRLWKDQNNPYAYLYQVKDKNGNQLYQPYPSPVRYPIISVYRKGYKLRREQNFSIHRMRHIAWTSIADSNDTIPGKEQQGTNLQLGDLGNVVTSRYPVAIDYSFQIDFFCNRPDTQAYFLSRFVQSFWQTGGDKLQTWIPIQYPVLGNRLIRLYSDSGIDSLTPEVPEEGKNVEFRLSSLITIEGFDIDTDLKVLPTLWGITFAPIDDNSLQNEVDLRAEGSSNPTVAYSQKMSNMPADGPYQPDTNDV